MKKWFQIEAKTKDGAEILIYDDIGLFGITAKDFITELRALGSPKNITVRINSLGGDVMDGFAIYNVLARHPAKITVIVDGIAASIASVIAMAGDKVLMPDNSFLVIHRSWGVVIGNAEDMEDWAEIMRKLDRGIILAYQKKSPRSAEEIEQLMSEESWLTAAEAKEWGFADEISEPIKLAARAGLEKFKNLPAALNINPDPPPDPDSALTVQDLEKIRIDAVREAETRAHEEAAVLASEISKLCAQARLPELTQEFLAKRMTLDEVKIRLIDADKIKSRCTAAKFPHRSLDFICAGLTPAEVTDILMKIVVAKDEALGEIENKLGPDSETSPTKGIIDSQAIYALRRGNGQGIGSRIESATKDLLAAMSDHQKSP